MSVPIKQPHTVSVRRPIATRDADSNAATEDVSGATPRSVSCMFQRRSGAVSVNPVGNEYTFDGILYVVDVDADLQILDRIDVDLPGLEATFNVSDVEPKYDGRGNFSHFEIPLSRNIQGN